MRSFGRRMLMGDVSRSKLRRGPSAQQATTPGVRDPWIRDVRRRLDRLEHPTLGWQEAWAAVITLCVILLAVAQVVR